MYERIMRISVLAFLLLGVYLFAESIFYLFGVGPDRDVLLLEFKVFILSGVVAIAIPIGGGAEGQTQRRIGHCRHQIRRINRIGQDNHIIIIPLIYRKSHMKVSTLLPFQM